MHSMKFAFSPEGLTPPFSISVPPRRMMNAISAPRVEGRWYYTLSQFFIPRGGFGGHGRLGVVA
eukprot:1317233-Rhodomonas_salina.1